MISRPQRCFLPAILGVWLALIGQILAADVSVRATLSHRSAEVGQPVQLQVTVDGSSSGTKPPDVDVDGLEVRYAGPSSSQQIQMINGQITRQITTVHVTKSRHGAPEISRFPP